MTQAALCWRNNKSSFWAQMAVVLLTLSADYADGDLYRQIY
jgi:hypothetical protein